MASDQRPRVAVIGVGSLGQHHARNYAELHQEGIVDLVGVCDSSAEIAGTIAEKHGCPAYTNWRDLVSQVQAVSIVTPTDTHCEIACEFLANGVDVLVEKPIALTLEQADQMIAAAEGSGALL